jgi:hypothetical protein
VPIGQRFEEILPVHVIAMNILPAIPATHNVVNGSGIFCSQLAWHRTHPAR